MNNLEEVKDIAILYKLKRNFENLECIPYKVITGIYNSEEEELIDEDGTPYRHIIEGNTYGFAARKSLREYNKQFPLIPTSILKKLILHYAKKFNYQLNQFGEENTPIINFCNKEKYNKENIFLDRDIIIFYITYYPESLSELEEQFGIKIIYEKQVDKENSTTLQIDNKEKEEKMDINVNKLYTEITKTVIDQNEPIKKILTAIWKQYNNFSPNKSRNILINGSTGVGKTEIFRQLTKKLDIPCYTANATEYTASGYIGKDISDMLKSLLDITNGDLKKAENGILIIDEIDKLSEANKSQSQVNQKDVQEALLKIIEDGKYDIMWHSKKYTFDTSNLMVVGIGSWSRVELKTDKVVGFEQISKPKQYKDLTTEDFVKNGMIPELIGRFPIIIQMNELNHDSYIRIINSDNGALQTNQEFLQKQGIKLIVTDEAKNEIALSAEKKGFGARSLDSIIETALSYASFEIASNPEAYNELIVTEETIKDNKVYTLKKKK